MTRHATGHPLSLYATWGNKTLHSVLTKKGIPIQPCWIHVVLHGFPKHAWHALQDTPVADAKPDDIKDLLGGALFKALFKWMQESGPVYLLPTGQAVPVVVIMQLMSPEHDLGTCAYPAS